LIGGGGLEKKMDREMEWIVGVLPQLLLLLAAESSLSRLCG